MFIRILLFTLIIPACSDHDFEARVEKGKRIVTPIPTDLPQTAITPQPTDLPQTAITPQPTDLPQTAERCTQSCDEACGEYTWQPWQPAAADTCEGLQVKQTRAGTRVCSESCSTCSTTTTATREVDGKKTTPCASHCSAWERVAGTEGEWSPATATVKKGKLFKQTRKEQRTCAGLCPNAECAVAREAEQDATGTKEAIVVAAAKQEECKPACSASCQGWSDWSAWTGTESCPAPTAFVKPSPATIEETRSRSRNCPGLCTGVQCFASNIETRIISCDYCQGSGQLLQADGNCSCDHKQDYYLQGGTCKKCESPQRLTQQAGGTWACIGQLKCTDWAQQGFAPSSKRADQVCDNVSFIPVYTFTRTCENCAAGDDCSTSKEEPGAAMLGEKTTPCDRHCSWGAWGKWTTTDTCPANTAFEKSSIKMSQQRTRTCEDLCKGTLCPRLGTNHKYEDCAYCKGTGQKLDSGGKCVCDASKGYYRDGDVCAECSSPDVLVDGKCVCDAANRYYRDGDTCSQCPTSMDFADGSCKAKPEPKVAEASAEVESPPPPPPPPPPVAENCADGCEAWKAWSDWALTTDSCPAVASFAKPTLEQQIEARSRSRTCTNLKAGLECFTSNTETRVTACQYCQGTGQKLDSGDECVCDASMGYYRDGDVCAECSSPDVLVDGNCSSECDDVCGDWQSGEWDRSAADVCTGEEFTPKRTLTRTCPAERSDCAESDTETSAPVTGSKTYVCDTDCGEWSTWGEWSAQAGKVCPTDTTAFEKTTITEVQTRSRTCEGEQCGAGCETSQSNERTTECLYCKDDDRILNAAGECVCVGNFYRVGDKCVACEAPKLLVSDGTSISCEDVPDPPIACNDTCSACGAWGEWPAWAGVSCPDSDSFTKPAANTEKSRTRTRTCNDLCEGVECLTTNTETRLCRWCKGVGQILNAAGECVCDPISNYYKDTDLSRCEVCAKGKVPNAAGTGCVCAQSSCVSNPLQEWDSVNCECAACKASAVDTCSDTGQALDTELCLCVEPTVEVEEVAEQPTSVSHDANFYQGKCISDLVGTENVNNSWMRTSVGDLDCKTAYKEIRKNIISVVCNTHKEHIITLYNCALNSQDNRSQAHRDTFMRSIRGENTGNSCGRMEGDTCSFEIPITPTNLGGG